MQESRPPVSRLDDVKVVVDHLPLHEHYVDGLLEHFERCQVPWHTERVTDCLEILIHVANERTDDAVLFPNPLFAQLPLLHQATIEVELLLLNVVAMELHCLNLMGE